MTSSVSFMLYGLAGPLNTGPQLGSSQRSLKRPRHFKNEAGDRLLDANGSRGIPQGNAIQQQRNNSWDQGLLSGASTQWQSPSDLEKDGLEETAHSITDDHNNYPSPGSACSTTASCSASTSLSLPAFSSIILPSFFPLMRYVVLGNLLLMDCLSVRRETGLARLTFSRFGLHHKNGPHTPLMFIS